MKYTIDIFDEGDIINSEEFEGPNALIEALDYIADEIDEDRLKGHGMIDYVLTDENLSIIPYKVVATLIN